MKQPFLDLGKQPIANAFLFEKDILNEYFYNLTVGYDKETHLVTHMEYVDSPLMFNENYAYRGSMSKTMVNHFKEFSNFYKLNIPNFYKLNIPNPKVLEIGSNDGVFLQNWKTKTTFAVEPCKNFADETNERGYKTYNEFFTLDLSEHIVEEQGKMDLIFSANCICHIPDLDQTFKAVANLLSDEGIFIMEDPSLAQMINSNSYDQIYDEHPHVFSIIALKNLVERNGLLITGVENTSVHGGSNRVWIKKFNKDIIPSPTVQQNIEFEKILGLDKEETFFKFADKVEQSKFDLKNLLVRCKELGKKVISYGATSKSTTIFNYCEIGPDLIEYIIDTTPEKIGKLAPGSHIPIINTERIEDDADVVFLGAWNFLKEIMDKEYLFVKRGGKFLTHVPLIKFV